MADAQSVIELVFEGVDKTSAAVTSVLKNTKSFASSIEDATQPIADFTVGALKIEAGLLAAGAAMTAFSVKTAGEFGASFNQISTLFDAGSEDVAAFKVAVQDYASTSGKSFEDVTSSLSAAIGAGVDYKDSLGLLTVAEKLSIVTRADLKGTTETLVSTLNSYGLSTKDASHLADQMFTIIKDGKIEMGDLAQSLALVAPVAAASGVSMDDLGAAIATLTAAGLQPSSAIEGLRAAISNIIQPSKQAQEMAKSLGIEFDANALKSKGLAGVLEDVRVATGGSAEQTAALFGSIQGMTAVMTLNGPVSEKFKQNIDHMGSSAGAVSEQYDKMASNIDISTQKIQNALKDVLISIGDPLLDEFGGVANAIAEIFLSIGDSANTGGVKTLVDYVEQQMKGLQVTLAEVAKNLPEALNSADLSGFTKGIDAIRGAFGHIFDGVDLTTPEGLRSAIEGIGKAFELLSKFTAGVIDSFEPLTDLLRDSSDGFKGIDSDSAQAAGKIAGFATQLNLLSGPATTVAASLIALNQALAIGGSIATATTALGTVGGAGLLGALSSLATLGAAGVAGFGIGTLANELAELTTGTSISTWISDMFSGDLEGQVDSATSSLEEIVVTAKKLNSVSVAPAGGIDELNEITVSARMWGESVEEAADRVERATASQEDWAKGLDHSAALYDIVSGKVLGYGEAAAKTEAALKSVAAATGGFNVEMEKLKSAEVLEIIKARSAENVAEIESDAKKTVAAFESINVGIKSTGDSLDNLFGLLGDDNVSKLDKLDVTRQIQKENERRDREFDQQERALNQRIKESQARIKTMENGGALITVNAPGLQPHLEAIWHDILTQLQIKTNAEGLQMLLGTA